jgi:hypothetical protein
MTSPAAVDDRPANRRAVQPRSPRTVNKHLEQIFTKLGMENRTSAAALAVRMLGIC